jgi:hypothetical protein
MKKWTTLISFAVCLLLVLTTASAQEVKYGSISGSITTGIDEDMPNGRVFFYDVTKGPSPYTSEYWRFQDYAVPLAGNGSFKASLPAGTYYLMAVMKAAGKKYSPPEEGDFIYPPWDGSVPETVTVKAHEHTEIGVMYKAVPFQREWAPSGTTGIEGTVLDADGNPAAGALVIAGTESTEGKLRYVSDRRTGVDGKYIVRVHEGGQYYLGIMAPRHTGIVVSVKTGAIKRGVDVHIQKNPGSTDMDKQETIEHVE